MGSEDTLSPIHRCCTSDSPHNLAGLHSTEPMQNGYLIECQTTSSTFFMHWTNKFHFCPGCGMYLGIVEARKQETVIPALDHEAMYKCGKCSLYLGPGAGAPDAHCPECKGEWVKIEGTGRREVNVSVDRKVLYKCSECSRYLGLFSGNSLPYCPDCRSKGVKIDWGRKG